MKNTCICILHFESPVIRASHTFYNATTSVPIDKADAGSRKRKTNTLNTTTHPEDKRKIIGDTFMKVSLVYFMICLVVVVLTVRTPSKEHLEDC